MTSISLAFESCSWTDEDMIVFYLMRTIIGSATAFSSGGPGKGMYCRAVTSLMQQNNFIDSAQVIGSHFSDSGLFGLKLLGPGSHGLDLLSAAVNELHKLREPISETELKRAKNITKMNMMMAMERQDDRLEEMARNYQTYGTLNFQEYNAKIDSITSS